MGDGGEANERRTIGLLAANISVGASRSATSSTIWSTLHNSMALSVGRQPSLAQRPVYISSALQPFADDQPDAACARYSNAVGR